MNNKVLSLLKDLKIRHKNIDFYVEALTHPSYNNEFSYSKNYQRLEFLGDSIIAKVVTLFLFKTFPKKNEGEMSLLRSRFVCQKFLAKLAKSINLGEYIRFGKSVKSINDKIYGEIFEAIVGAIYIDKGNVEVVRFLEPILLHKIKNAKRTNNKDPKTMLQEFLKSESRDNVKYDVVKKRGGFQAKVVHHDNLFGVGVGKTKKQAETAAAKQALKRLRGNNEAN